MENQDETLVSIFIEFIEAQARRIDEERHGAYRRDGGRKIACEFFLDKLKNHFKKDMCTSVENVETYYGNPKAEKMVYLQEVLNLLK